MNLTQALYAVLMVGLALLPQVLSLLIGHYADDSEMAK
jgi:hypothetical protein